MNRTLHGIQSAGAVASRAKSSEVTPTAKSFVAAARRLDTIGDPVRLRILWWLGQGERSVTDLCGLVSMRQQAVTHHLNIMKLTRLIAFHREGRYNLYRLTETGEE